MLIEFKFRNFLSFKDEMSFLMTNVRTFTEHLDKNIIVTGKEFDLLKSAAVYGMNAAGKSNFVSALSFMVMRVHESFSDSLKKESDRPTPDYYFKLNSKTEKEPSMFEISFLYNDNIYRYGFEIKGFEIIKEWLFRKKEREILLFQRSKMSFEINANSFKEGLKFKKEVNENVLFLSHLAQNNQKISKEIVGWFKGVNAINSLTDDHYSTFTKHLMKTDPIFKKWISSALKFLEISDVEAGEDEGEIITYHNKYDENNLLVESVPFSIEKNESSGTVKLIYLLGPLFHTLRNGRVLFIDEFDVKLHVQLTRKLMKLFNEFSQNGAQIIFTGHDINLMDKNLVRRDQIWFVSKDQYGASEMYSLSEFNSDVVRKGASYDKYYLENKFGAAEAFEINDELTNALYGK